MNGLIWPEENGNGKPWERYGLKDVTAEQILATNPDIMIDGDNAAEVREALKSMPEWSDITAVKTMISIASPKAVSGGEDFAEIPHYNLYGQLLLFIRTR